MEQLDKLQLFQDNKIDTKTSIDFESLIKEMHELKEKEYMSSPEAFLRIEAFDRVISSIENKDEAQTIRIRILKEILLKTLELDPDANEYIRETFFYQDSPEYKKGELKVNASDELPEKVSGRHKPGEIEIRAGNFKEILFNLADKGNNPTFGTVMHEVVHDFQNPKENDLKKVVGGFLKNDNISAIINRIAVEQAKEAQSYTSEFRAGSDLENSSLLPIMRRLNIIK